MATLSGNGITASYTYDVDGLRTSKTVNGVKHEYYYVGSTLQYEKFGTTELWFFYDSDGNPSGVRYKNGSTTTDYYFVCNWRGDVIRIYDGTGAVVANYNYDAWGSVISVTDSNGTAITDSTHIANVNPICYRGYYFDAETGLYYVNSRYYDPEVKRMLSSDDALLSAASPQALTDKNYFAYCDNNPVTRADGDGDYWHIVIGAAVGGVISATTQAIDQGGIHSGKDVAKIALSAVTGAVGGGLGASGIISNTICAAFVDAGLTAVNDIGLAWIDNGYSFKNVDWVDVGINTVISFGVSSTVGIIYGELTKTSTSKLEKSIEKGKNKIVKGITSNRTSHKVKGTIKAGQRMIAAGRKGINKIQLRGSAIGSIASGAVSTAKSFLKSLFNKRGY